MITHKTITRLEKALDILLNTEIECNGMGKGNTFSEAVDRIRTLISCAEEKISNHS
ncbi:hypothetical protein LCGC14_0420950 [marine sediment metagenome]|uniref:Uncharacterized protein n=1 Tax=marine sediment metagenome TaxID=412755 RepID=A0A0F9W009_9ZZZZ